MCLFTWSIGRRTSNARATVRRAGLKGGMRAAARARAANRGEGAPPPDARRRHRSRASQHGALLAIASAALCAVAIAALWMHMRRGTPVRARVPPTRAETIDVANQPCDAMRRNWSGAERRFCCTRAGAMGTLARWARRRWPVGAPQAAARQQHPRSPKLTAAAAAAAAGAGDAACCGCCVAACGVIATYGADGGAPAAVPSAGVTCAGAAAAAATIAKPAATELAATCATAAASVAGAAAAAAEPTAAVSCAASATASITKPAASQPQAAGTTAAAAASASAAASRAACIAAAGSAAAGDGTGRPFCHCISRWRASTAAGPTAAAALAAAAARALAAAAAAAVDILAQMAHRRCRGRLCGHFPRLVGRRNVRGWLARTGARDACCGTALNDGCRASPPVYAHTNVCGRRRAWRVCIMPAC
jgi:hypothetical protein